MRRLSIEEAKQIELDILAFIDSFCKSMILIILSIMAP